jgi:hypothetical protein
MEDLSKEEINKINNSIKLIDTYGSKLKCGEKIEIDCTECDGKITIRKSSYNGHISASCNKCDLMIIQ